MLKKLIEKLYFKFHDKDVDAAEFSKQEKDRILDELSLSAEDFRDLLKAIMKGDKKRYFIARNDEERHAIKGEYRRTLYIYKSLEQKKRVAIPVKSLGISRYGG